MFSNNLLVKFVNEWHRELIDDCVLYIAFERVKFDETYVIE